MGCASSKQFHDHNLRNELKIKPRKGSSSSLRRLVSFSSSKRREDLEEEEEVVVIANTERSSSLRLIPKTHNNNTSIPAQSGESENKANTATEVTGHHRRRRSRVNGTGFDARVGNKIDDENVKEEGKVNSNPNLNLRGDVPNGAETEQVSAGWPRWLTDVAGEAVRGWVPRKAESFEKLDKVYLLT
jgi:hypothetical protein